MELNKSLTEMPQGRDLRNNLVYFDDKIYAIGGNNCSGERYIISKNKWEPIAEYFDLMHDNLVILSNN